MLRHIICHISDWKMDYMLHDGISPQGFEGMFGWWDHYILRHIICHLSDWKYVWLMGFSGPAQRKSTLG